MFPRHIEEPFYIPRTLKNESDCVYVGFRSKLVKFQKSESVDVNDLNFDSSNSLYLEVMSVIV